jgi:transcriptional regulator with XRE-family HTH domain
MTKEETKRIRKGLGLTQSQFAKVLGYTHYSRVSYFETGEKPIPETTARLAKMYQIFGIPDELKPQDVA